MRKQSLVGYLGKNWSIVYKKHYCKCIPVCKPPYRELNIFHFDYGESTPIVSRNRNPGYYKKVRITIEEMDD